MLLRASSVGLASTWRSTGRFRATAPGDAAAAAELGPLQIKVTSYFHQYLCANQSDKLFSTIVMLYLLKLSSIKILYSLYDKIFM
jgi:hypothetical protein